MVANSKQANQQISIDSVETVLSTANDPITKFLRENPGRVLIVDFLNIMIGGAFGARDLSELCKTLEAMYPTVPIIIVTKKVAHWPNVDSFAAEEITLINSNILILVCDARDSKKKISTKRGNEKDHPLAQADDHLIALLTIAISAAGCAPMILSEDKYRNSAEVFKTIPRYEYTAYKSGIASTHWIESEHCSEWILQIALDTVEHRIKCGYILAGRCKNCSSKGQLTCVWCGICIVCTMELLASTYGEIPVTR